MRTQRAYLRKAWWKASSYLARLRYYRGPRPLKVLIVGNARAGTSFLAGLIHKMGFSLGPEGWLKPPDEHNLRGYFECLALREISQTILARLGGDFHNVPQLFDGWTKGFDVQKKQIIHIVEAGGIELYKECQLLILADLFNEIFPHVKWVYIQRDLRESYASRFGERISSEDYVKICGQRFDRWERSQPAKRALRFDYADFRKDAECAVRKLEAFLKVRLTDEQFEICRESFRPRRR